MSPKIRQLASEAGKSLKVIQEWEQKTRTGPKETHFDRCFIGEKVFGLGHGNLHFNVKLKTDPSIDPYVIIKYASEEIINDLKIKIEYSARSGFGSLTYNPKVESLSHFKSDCPTNYVFQKLFSSTNGNEIKVTFKVTFEIELKKTEMPTPKSNLLHKLYSDVELSDVKIHCGGKVFSCHKVILSGQSEVFKNMLLGNSIEATSGKVEITDISASAMENLLFYVYHEDLDGAKVWIL